MTARPRRRPGGRGCALRQRGQQRRAALAAGLDEEAVLGRPSSSVSARSKPAVALGPVPIETQKQVPPASPQLTATMNAPSRRAW